MVDVRNDGDVANIVACHGCLSGSSWRRCRAQWVVVVVVKQVCVSAECTVTRVAARKVNKTRRFDGFHAQRPLPIGVAHPLWLLQPWPRARHGVADKHGPSLQSLQRMQQHNVCVNCIELSV